MTHLLITMTRHLGSLFEVLAAYAGNALVGLVLQWCVGMWGG